jgi:DNA replication and repair protein RecF
MTGGEHAGELAAGPCEARGALPAPTTAKPDADAIGATMFIERLQLDNFRNYRSLSLTLPPEPIVVCGPNGAGKTNLLEALSLLTSGHGLRQAPYLELARAGSAGWSIAARVRTPTRGVDLGTGLTIEEDGSRRGGRTVHVDGEARSGVGALEAHLSIVWLTPLMDGLFTAGAADRRRFLDRLVACFDPGFRARLARFERAMQQRNRLLALDVREGSRFRGLERIMAETGVAIAAARTATLAELATAIEQRRGVVAGRLFPLPQLALAGSLETALACRPALDVEDAYCDALEQGRERDRGAGRTLVGPHRSDFLVRHGETGRAARLCSTGEQKALLIGLVLAHADLLRRHGQGAAPILLLDEIAAHLDPARRAALFEALVALGAQVVMSGTDPAAFAALGPRAHFLWVANGSVGRLG